MIGAMIGGSIAGNRDGRKSRASCGRGGSAMLSGPISSLLWTKGLNQAIPWEN